MTQEMGFFDKSRYGPKFVFCVQIAYMYYMYNKTYIMLLHVYIVFSRTGELTNRLAADTQVVQSAVTENLSMLARYTLQMLISLGLMFYINAKLTAVLLSVVPIIAVAAVQYGECFQVIPNINLSFMIIVLCFIRMEVHVHVSHRYTMY